MNPAASLAGRAVLLTRPAGQATALALGIERRGGRAVLLPTLELRPTVLSDDALRVLAALGSYDHAIFVSANAVQFGLRHVGPWPAHLEALAVGSATAAALREQGISRVVTPADGSDSEALLRLPQLRAPEGRRIVIFRGRGGRELLAHTLRERGAQVDYVESYERLLPECDPAAVIELCRHHALHAVCVSSVEGLDNLFTLLGAHASCLHALPMFVLHLRQAARAQALGVMQTVLTGPGDEALLCALERHFAPH